MDIVKEIDKLRGTNNANDLNTGNTEVWEKKVFSIIKNLTLYN